MLLVRTACCLLLMATLGACGSERGGPDPAPPAQGAWESQVLSGARGADHPTVLAVDGETALVLMLSDRGRLRSHLSVEGRPFSAGEPLETGWRFAALAGAVRHEDAWITLGSGGLADAGADEELTFTVRAFRSSDGLTWEDAPVEGFAAPADVHALVEVEGVLLAAGSHRGAEDPAMGGFRAGVWTSRDGSTWTEPRLPEVVDDGDSFVADLAVDAGRVYAVGRSGDHAMLWTSDDAGSTWQASNDPEVRGSLHLAQVAAEDGVVVLTGSARDSARVLRSEDGGLTWASATTPPPSDDIEGDVPLWAGGGRFFTVTEPSVEVWSEPEVCYADIDQCGGSQSGWVLYASDDGDSWTPVDASGIDAGDELAEVVGTPSGRVLVMHGLADGVAMNTWPAGIALPTGSAPAPPARVELVTVPRGADPEPGVRYHAPLYIHCGMDWLYLGDRPWQRTDGGPETETGAGADVPDSWPVAGETVFGYATLGEDGVVEYATGSGEVIATYARTATQPPGCD